MTSLDNVAKTADPAFVTLSNERALKMRNIGEILDDETINNCRVILESIQEARDAYPNKAEFDKGTIRMDVAAMEVLLGKVVAVKEILLRA